MGDKFLPEVFIIESLRREDEPRRREGKALRGILRMMGRRPKYVYIRTAQELRLMVEEFQESDYRYLHLSCHGNQEGFELTLDFVTFADFATLFRSAFAGRRLFLSACSIAQEELAEAVFDGYDQSPYSITGPSSDIYFADATVTWAALYNLLFRDEQTNMTGKSIRTHLKRLCAVNDIEFVYFGRSRQKPNYKMYRLPTKRRSHASSRALAR